MKELKIIKFYGWSIILQGLIIYILSFCQGMKFDERFRGGDDFADFSFFQFPIYFVILFGYCGIQIIRLKKTVLREVCLLSIIMLIIGVGQVFYGIGIWKWNGGALIAFYSSFLYLITRPKIKVQFE